MRMTAAAFLLLALPATASAGCFENLGNTGCTDSEVFGWSDLRGLSCQNLWYVRNSIYDDHGYCFKTAAAKAEFNNAGCSVNDAAQIRFNGSEQGNISRIVQVEKEKGCKRQ